MERVRQSTPRGSRDLPLKSGWKKYYILRGTDGRRFFYTKILSTVFCTRPKILFSSLDEGRQNTTNHTARPPRRTMNQYILHDPPASRGAASVKTRIVPPTSPLPRSSKSHFPGIAAGRPRCNPPDFVVVALVAGNPAYCACRCGSRRPPPLGRVPSRTSPRYSRPACPTGWVSTPSPLFPFPGGCAASYRAVGSGEKV